MPDEPNRGVGPVVDPTKNVLDLVEAAVKRLDDLFAASTKRLDERIDALVGRIDAEADKSTALRAQREYYEARIEGLLERQTDKAAGVLADNVRAALERLAVVEKNQYQTGGQASVRDPAISNEIAKMTATLEVLSKAGNQSTGKSEGMSQIGAIVLGVCTVIVAATVVAGFIIART